VGCTEQVCEPPHAVQLAPQHALALFVPLLDVVQAKLTGFVEPGVCVAQVVPLHAPHAAPHALSAVHVTHEPALQN
jgi:hypothetical protein